MTQAQHIEHYVPCCIVGGGPAGVMAGALLARAGVGALVLEKHGDFLRDFRGDTVHPSTMDVLAELGWLDDFLRLPHQRIEHLRGHIGDQEIQLADFTHVPAHGKFVALMPQWTFLDFLTEKARAFDGFDIWMNAEGVAPVEHGGRVTGVRGVRPGVPFTILADLVIGADGRHSTMREHAGLRVHDIGAPIDVLWFRLPREAGDPAQGLGWLTEHRFAVLIDRGDYWQIACIIKKGSFDEVKAQGIEAFRATIGATTPFLRDRAHLLASFDDVKLLSVKIDRLERWYKDGLLCLGDAAHAMSPVGGVGINLAIQDAVAAANLLAKPLRRGVVTLADLARVQRRRELPTRATQALQVVIQARIIRRVLEGSGPVKAGLLLRTIDRFSLLQRIPARLVGVGVRPEHVRRGATSP